MFIARPPPPLSNVPYTIFMRLGYCEGLDNLKDVHWSGFVGDDAWTTPITGIICVDLRDGSIVGVPKDTPAQPVDFYCGESVWLDEEDTGSTVND